MNRGTCLWIFLLTLMPLHSAPLKRKCHQNQISALTKLMVFIPAMCLQYSMRLSLPFFPFCPVNLSPFPFPEFPSHPFFTLMSGIPACLKHKQTTTQTSKQNAVSPSTPRAVREQPRPVPHPDSALFAL